MTLSSANRSLDVADQGRSGMKIVCRYIEEALDLSGVKIDRKNTIDARPGDEIGDELGRNRCARARLAILPGIAEVGDDCGNPPC